jgi:hypothetical protein
MEFLIEKGKIDSNAVELGSDIPVGIYVRNLDGGCLQLSISHDGKSFVPVFLEDSGRSFKFNIPIPKVITINDPNKEARIIPKNKEVLARMFPSILRRKLDGVNFLKLQASKPQKQDVRIKLIASPHDSMPKN